MKLRYKIEIADEISEIEEIHNHLDMVFMREGLSIKKSILESDGELAEITIHDGEKKCRVCGCDWFHACTGGCYWVEEDLCSSCAGESVIGSRQDRPLTQMELEIMFEAKGM